MIFCLMKIFKLLGNFLTLLSNSNSFLKLYKVGTYFFRYFRPRQMEYGHFLWWIFFQLGSSSNKVCVLYDLKMK